MTRSSYERWDTIQPIIYNRLTLCSWRHMGSKRMHRWVWNWREMHLTWWDQCSLVLRLGLRWPHGWRPRYTVVMMCSYEKKWVNIINQNHCKAYREYWLEEAIVQDTFVQWMVENQTGDYGQPSPTEVQADMALFQAAQGELAAGYLTTAGWLAVPMGTLTYHSSLRW